MEPLVSVIVPVYNVEKYVAACLESICAQSLEKIEIIVIDDGSKDNSGKICDIYAQKDPRIKVKHQPNQGLSAARNAGIALAKAPYIMFVDSDDEVHADFCRIPYETACSEQADLVIFGHLRNGKPAYHLEGRDMQMGVQEKETVLRAGRQYMGNYAWNKLYKIKLFNDIRFPEGRLYEAIGTTYRLVLKAEKIIYLPQNLYFYKKHKGTISSDRSKNNFLERIDMMQQYSDGVMAGGLEKEGKDSALSLAMIAVMRLGTKEKAVQRYVNDLKNAVYVPEEWNHSQRILLKQIKRSNMQFEVYRRLFQARNLLLKIYRMLRSKISRKF